MSVVFVAAWWVSCWLLGVFAAGVVPAAGRGGVLLKVGKRERRKKRKERIK